MYHRDVWRCGFLVLGACGRLGFDPIGGASGDATDGVRDVAANADTSAIGCVSPGDPDSFDTPGGGCDTWGSGMVSNGTMTEAGSAVVIMLDTGGASSASCKEVATVPFTNGVFAEISAVAQGAGALTGFGADDGASLGFLQFNEENGTLSFYKNGTSVGSVAYDPVAMRWWRLRPDATGTTTFFETSPDGLDWLQRGSTGTSFVTVQAFISASAPGLATQARFEGVDVCP